MPDPKLLAVALPLLGIAGAFIWRMGKKSAQGAISKELEQLHADLERAHSTPDPADDSAVEAKIKAKERLKAALDALPDNL